MGDRGRKNWISSVLKIDRGSRWLDVSCNFTQLKFERIAD
jgi:hypothetical protein